jgi:diaminopimelate epimerase
MQISFYKYHGTGNDFILIDNRHQQSNNYTIPLIQHLCHRRFGIGADGLILLQSHPQYDFEMIYYNADGSQSLCGNGSRCAVDLANHLGIIGDKTYFLTTDGPHQALIQEKMIWLQIKDIAKIQPIGTDYFVDTGSPHYIRIVDDLVNLDVYHLGKTIRNQEPFQKVGTNVNFVQLEGNNTIAVRTYERGVENETLSCGTGVTAAALVASTKGLKSPIQVNTKGGELQVHFTTTTQGFTDIYLVGPAVRVFQGTINVII